MTLKTTLKGEPGLPPYFSAAFDTARRLRHGQLDIRLPDGRTFRAAGEYPGPVATLCVQNNDLFGRLLRDGDLGFAEAYLDGWWSTPDLQAVMDLIHAENDNLYEGFLGLSIVRAFERLRFWLRRNTKHQAKKNIASHYDLGNDFYALWLDDTMTYSAALFQTGQESLEAAQTAKYASLLDHMNVQRGDHVLEIGCGWGGFAEYAAKERGLKVTALTISKAQHAHTTARMRALGLEDRVTVKLQDYRDERGRYDGIASIEMFEAVGEKYWPLYFRTLRTCLKPGKTAALQIITVQDTRWAMYRKSVDFIQKYIFPGGMLPAPSVLRAEVAKAGLSVKETITFGESYSQTLRRWHERFNAQWTDIATLDFDDRFRRMWNFYLTSCAAAFRSGYCDVTQISVMRAG